jgi:hypothetical protein
LSRDSEFRGDGHVSGALDEIPKAVVVALLPAGRGRHGHNHRPFITPLNSSRTIGASEPDMTTTRAGECRMSVGTARLAARGEHAVLKSTLVRVGAVAAILAGLLR